MTSTKVMWWVIAGLLAASLTAAAHPLQYFNTNAVATGYTGPLADCPKPLGSGFVVFCPGHLVPNGLGQAGVTIIDDVNSPVVMYYCQDLNQDGWCGGNPLILPPAPYGRDPLTGHRGEPWFGFCGSATIQSPLSFGYKTPSEWADPGSFGGNWDPAFAVIFFMRGYAEANPAYAPCGLDSFAAPTHGFFVH